MRELLRLLFSHPEFAVFAVAALIAVVGGVVKRAAVLAQKRGPSPAAPAARTAKASRPTPEQVAAEMRQILGMDGVDAAATAVKPPPSGRKPAAGWKPAPPQQPARSRQPVGRRPVAPPQPPAARLPTPRPARDLGQIELHVEPHVGEQIEQRRAPATGSVGKIKLGTLGGRPESKGRLQRRAFSRLVDLQDLPRALVLREILDRPLSLREDWPYR